MTYCFDGEIARLCGVNAAVLYYNIRFWCLKSKANGRHFHDGRWWMYNSAKAFAELFPFFTTSQIETSLKKLTENGLILKGNYNEHAYDRIGWYACADLESGKASQSDPVSISENAEMHSGEIGTRYQIVNTDSNPDSKPYISKHQYGQYKNVLLSDEDIDKLKVEFPEDWQERIERLSDYIESKGAKYKSHLATIRVWAKKDKKPVTQAANQPSLPDASSAWDTVLEAVRKYGHPREVEAMQKLPPTIREAVKVITFRAICMSDRPDIIKAQFFKAYADALKGVDPV